MSDAEDGGDGAAAPPKKKKKIGKKERMKLKAKQLMEQGMSEADARREAGLNQLPTPAAANNTAPTKKKTATTNANGKNNNNNNNGPSPALLTANIKNAKSLREMFELMRRHGRKFNHIHLSAFWNLLGRITSSNGFGGYGGNI